nr:MAG TPA: hypothetical protein [Caudoviricetes sp.]
MFFGREFFDLAIVKTWYQKWISSFFLINNAT